VSEASKRQREQREAYLRSQEVISEPESLSDEERLARIRTHGRQVWSSDVGFLLRLLDEAYDEGLVAGAAAAIRGEFK
jgi:hypothetical protein